MTNEPTKIHAWLQDALGLGNELQLPIQERLEGETHMARRLPVSFSFGEKPFSEWIQNCEKTLETTPQENGTTLHLVTYRDGKSGLECCIEATQFPDFAAAEWVVRFKNTSIENAPILEAVQALDIAWSSSNTDVILHHSRGSHGQVEDFQLVSEILYRNESFIETKDVSMAPSGGRSSQDWLPFFNLQTGDTGLFSAIGWSGEWNADFRYKEGVTTARAGMANTRVSLLPNEEIRTPRILLLFWQGDLREAHNIFRRFTLKYHTPQQNGAPATTPICCATWGGMNTQAHLERVEMCREHELSYDCYWVDAGWYGTQNTDCPDVFTGDWSSQTGNWNVNTFRHPNGLHPISDAAHAAGMQSLLWFEPERALVGTALTEEHPNWFLGERVPGGNLLLNLGNEDARKWLIEMISARITEEKLDWYRQDFNMEPLEFWCANDSETRQGITEIRHIEGLYAVWDALRTRHPHLLIDNCASGGRRLDLEMLGRSIVLWRSDYQCFYGVNPTGMQVQLHGLSHWLPLHIGGTLLNAIGDTYAFRSCMSAGLADQTFMYESGYPATPEDWAWLRIRLAEQKRLRPYFYGDFYALIPCSTSPEAWSAYQCFLPETQQGFMLTFRREKSPFRSASLPLGGLDAGMTYRFEDADVGKIWELSGAEVLENGFETIIEKQRESRLIFFSAI